jgi:chromosome segregation ATPase
MRHPVMHKLAMVIAFALTLALPAIAHAQSETDRLREALRSATVQLRSLEDQRAALQAKQAVADRDRDRLQKQSDAFKAQVKDAEEEFNKRLAERDESLEKWKSAYEEAATVARSKDAERAKFEAESAAFKASTKACEAKNVQLFKASDEMLTRFKSMNLLDAVAAREPAFGIKRVELQNLLQDYRDKLLDQKVKP